MYLGKTKEARIRSAAAEIKRLATMETCGLPDEVKEKVRLWVKWFDVEAKNILDALDNRKSL